MRRKQAGDQLMRELGAVAADLPVTIAPQLATLVKFPPSRKAGRTIYIG
jgi:hypothetical protein